MDDAPVRRDGHRRGDEPALPVPARARTDRAVRGVRPPHADGVGLGPPTCRRRGGQDRRRDRLDRGHGTALRCHPSGRGLDVDDDQRDRADPAPALRARGRGTGDRGRLALGHRAERPPEGVRGPRHVHLPAEALDAADHRSVRVLRRADPQMEHDLGERLPHARGGSDGGAGGGVHARGRDRVRAGGDRRRARGGPVRAACLVLLRLPHELLRGDREVPRPAACGRRSWPNGSGRRTRRA